MTPGGPVVLDQEPDVREVLLLADELKLDEVLAVLCVQGALHEVRSPSARFFACLLVATRIAVGSRLTGCLVACGCHM